MACRPLYQPHVGQTTWGSLALWHWGQMLRAGVLRTHALARRLRLLAFDVFFFGTAIVSFLSFVAEVSWAVDRCGPPVRAGPHN